MSLIESVSYCGSGSASKINPSITKPNATNNPKTKYQRPNSLKVGAGMLSNMDINADKKNPRWTNI